MHSALPLAHARIGGEQSTCVCSGRKCSSAKPFGGRALHLKVCCITEWMGILMGCGVVFEIYRVGLSAYPGTARLARNLLAFVFLLAFAKVLVETWNDPHWWSMA